MDEDLAAAVRTLHDTLMASIAADEALARECADMAGSAEQEGNYGFAEVLRSLSRRHQVKAFELARKLALLKAEFPRLLQPES
jgi:hypothetical protein